MAIRRFTIGLCALMVLSGRSSMLVKDASPEEDAKAKQFSSDAANAVVYFFRNDGFLGGDLIGRVAFGEKTVAEVARNRFNIVSAPPGHYAFTVWSNDMGLLPSLLHNAGKPVLELDLKADVVYFVQLEWEGYKGFYLHSTTRDVAEPIIKKGKLISKQQL